MKRKNRPLSAVVLGMTITVLSAAVLIGCTKTEVSQGVDIGTEEQNAQMEDETAKPAGDAEKVQENAANAGDLEDTAESAGRTSMVFEVSTGEGIDWAIWSEGIYCYSNGDLCGYLSEAGDRITPCIYEEASPFSEGMACVYRDGKYGYIGKDGEMVLPFVYDQASPFREGVAYFSIGEEYGFIDREGNAVLELTDCDSISSFREGLAYFSVDGQYGYMDKDGNVIVEPVYDDAGYFHYGLAVVIKDGLVGVIEKDGKEILAPEYIDVRTTDTCILARKGNTEFIYDMSGNELFSAPDSRVSKENGIFYIYMDGKTGLADESGNIILEPIYEIILPILERELVMVRNEEKEYGILDYEGQIVVPFCHYDSVSDFVGGRAVVKLDGKCGILRYDGTLELPIEYDRIRLFSDGSMAVWTGGIVEVTDSAGNSIFTGDYYDFSESGDGYWCYPGINKRIDFRDRQGNLISEYDYGSGTLSSAYGVKNTYIVGDDLGDGDRLLQRGAEEEATLEEVLLTNRITPKIKAFIEITESTDSSRAEDMGYGRQWWRYGKLYRMGKEGVTVLYFYEEPFHPFFLSRMSCSDLYMVRNGRAESLIGTSECKGTGREGRVCFWYDTKEGSLKPGITWAARGIMDVTDGAEVYKMKQRELVLENSFARCEQAESVVEYTVNEEQVSVEDYNVVRDRYICYWPLDMN